MVGPDRNQAAFTGQRIVATDEAGDKELAGVVLGWRIAPGDRSKIGAGL